MVAIGHRENDGEIENAGHNLFMVSPEGTETILAFMRGEEIENTRLTVELLPYGR